MNIKSQIRMAGNSDKTNELNGFRKLISMVSGAALDVGVLINSQDKKFQHNNAWIKYCAGHGWFVG